MPSFQMLLLKLTVVTSVVGSAEAHGRLVEPPSRASAWRYGFDTPHNYNDHELFCGGFTRQWRKNAGRCGVCGDAWDQPTPRPHELGGRFGRGVIVRRYAVGAPITIRVELTASHFGYFQFGLCDRPRATTQECLDEHILARDNGETRFYPRDGNKLYELSYNLPTELTCEHCVVQWRYIAGNNWGECANGTGAVGCGPQEEFRACADVAVGNVSAPVTPRARPPYVPPGRRTTTTPAPPAPPAPPASSAAPGWAGALVAALTLLAVLLALASLYLYYYRGGRGIKSLLKRQQTAAAPVRPPRARRATLTRDLDAPDATRIANMEPGFENVSLRVEK